MSKGEKAVGRNEIEKLLPHREPFLYVYRIESVEDNTIVTRWRVKEKEFFFKGHYPGNPITPGVIICEAMFQSGALLMASLLEDEYADKMDQDEIEAGRRVPVVTRVNNVRFKKMVKPGDTLVMTVIFTEKVGSVYCFKGRARVDGKLAASCDFICTMVEEQ